MKEQIEREKVKEEERIINQKRKEEERKDRIPGKVSQK
jgi:hypothetical protein